MQRLNQIAFLMMGWSVTALGGTARADVKVVSLLSVSGAVPSAKFSPSVQTVKTYYQGNDARVEQMGLDGSTLLFKGGEGKVYTLDTVKKTYFVRFVKDVSAPLDPAEEGAGGADLNLSEGEETRAFAGMVAQVYRLSGSVPVSSEQSAKYLLGGSSKPVNISGEYWLSNDLVLPNASKANVFPALISPNPAEDFLFKALADNLSRNPEVSRQIPLDSRITLTQATPQGNPATVTVTMEAITVSLTVLPKSLFELPADYRKIASPELQMQL